MGISVFKVSYSYQLKEGNRKARIEAERYKYAIKKNNIWTYRFNLFSSANVIANKVKATPNKVAPFINTLLKNAIFNYSNALFTSYTLPATHNILSLSQVFHTN